MVSLPPPAVQLAEALRPLGWVSDLLLGGSAATGDHRPGVSDLDLVALTNRPVGHHERTALIEVHRQLDAAMPEARLGCVYVDGSTLRDQAVRHPTWTHSRLVERPLSGIARAELLRHGVVIFGRRPEDLLPPMRRSDVREAARAELTGYWAKAARRPWWCDPSLVDLALVSMARARHTMATGDLMPKSAALDEVAAPEWLRVELRDRRDGRLVRSPRLRAAWLAWRDVRRTVAGARQAPR